jgi:hydrogenase nickel incorporation protein HypA/HybF
MHELKIAEELSVIVVDKAREARLSVVERVNVSFGQLVQIVPDIFEFAFREAVRDTIAAEAALNIEIIPLEMRCLSCGAEYAPAENISSCSACGAQEITVVHGKELFIKSIEGE